MTEAPPSETPNQQRRVRPSLEDLGLAPPKPEAKANGHAPARADENVSPTTLMRQSIAARNGHAKDDDDGSEQWPDGCDKRGPRPKYGNTLLAVSRLYKLKLDGFRQHHLITGHGYSDARVIEQTIRQVRHSIYQTFRFHPSRDLAAEVVHVLAEQNAFNPVSDWLKGLKWDGTERLDKLLVDYLGAEDSALNRAYARKTMCALVSRILRPGTKFDHVLTLKGPQNLGKSMFWRDVAGADDLFTDNEVLKLDARAQMEAVEGKLIIEMAELAGFSKADIEKVKAFITRAAERARPAYGRFHKEVPRTCILVGTTNQQNFLRDLTGNRRWWVVTVSKYDRERFLRERDQLFAEAAVRLNNGEQLYLNPDLYAAAAAVNEQHMEIIPYYERLADLKGTQVGDEERVYSAKVFDFLGIDMAAAGRVVQRDIAAAMGRHKFERDLIRIGKDPATGKPAAPKHGYKRPWYGPWRPKR